MAENGWDQLLAEAGVPGMAAAVIRDGRLHRTVCCGVRGAQDPTPVDEDTVFEAASLSKPVFAHAVLQLVDEGRLTLDQPLGAVLPGYVAGDERAAAITARHVLGHSAGLPNWRDADRPLRTYFPPGERFSYSGEGFWYLQKAVEAITGEALPGLVGRLVFGPFGMARSSFVWDGRFAPNRAWPHDDYGSPALGFKPGEANAAWSLQTTAADWGRFLVRVLDGSRLRPETAGLWLQPQVEVRHAGPQDLVGTAEVGTGVSWGLGWGLEPGEGAFFHWGNNGPFRAYTVGSVRDRAALAFLMNGGSGLSLMPEMVGALMPGHRPSLAWLGYGRHDGPARHLLRAAREHGIAAVWGEVEEAGLDGNDLLWIARGLTAAGRDADAAWLRARLEEDAALKPAARP